MSPSRDPNIIHTATRVGLLFNTLHLPTFFNPHTTDLSSIPWCPSQGPHMPHIDQYAFWLMLKTLNLAMFSNSHLIDLFSIPWCPSQGPHICHI